MSDDLEKKLLEQIAEIKEDVREIKKFMPTTDVISNVDYCKYKGIAYPTLIGWFKKDCPRIDSRRVSKKAVDDWAAENNTRKPKK